MEKWWEAEEGVSSKEKKKSLIRKAYQEVLGRDPFAVESYDPGAWGWVSDYNWNKGSWEDLLHDITVSARTAGEMPLVDKPKPVPTPIDRGEPLDWGELYKKIAAPLSKDIMGEAEVYTKAQMEVLEPTYALGEKKALTAKRERLASMGRYFSPKLASAEASVMAEFTRIRGAQEAKERKYALETLERERAREVETALKTYSLTQNEKLFFEQLDWEKDKWDLEKQLKLELTDMEYEAMIEMAKKSGWDYVIDFIGAVMPDINVGINLPGKKT